MRRFAIFLVLLTLVCGAVFGYAHLNTRLELTPGSVQMTPANQLPQEFERWMKALSAGAQCTVFDPNAAGNANDYGFMVYTLQIKNSGLIKAEMLELQLSPLRGDVLCFSPEASLRMNVNTGITLAPGQETTMQLILLTKIDSPTMRDLKLSYYIWGHPFFIELSQG